MAIADLYKLEGLLPARVQGYTAKCCDYILLLAMGAFLATGSDYIDHPQKGVASPMPHAPHRQPTGMAETTSSKIYSLSHASVPASDPFIYKQTKSAGKPAAELFDYDRMGCDLLRAIISTVTGVIFEDYTGNGTSRPLTRNLTSGGTGATVHAAGYSPMAGR